MKHKFKAGPYIGLSDFSNKNNIKHINKTNSYIKQWVMNWTIIYYIQFNEQIFRKYGHNHKLMNNWMRWEKYKMNMVERWLIPHLAIPSVM